MYFASRAQAGRMLAAKLKDSYRYENCAVVALSDGGVVVAAEIAQQLHCILTYLVSTQINLPMEPMPIAGITASGEFTYNPSYSSSELEDLGGEYRNYIEQQKLEKMDNLNRLLSGGGTIKKDLLRGHNILLVADFIKDGFILDLAMQFLKPINLESIIIATPLASVRAVDKMHICADKLFCLSVTDEFHEANHYYDNNFVPNHNEIVSIIENIILNWH
jgi:putative phosphoribosyl transferase